jgi:hypothetical protein
MQDRLPPDRRKPLATRRRTIHWVNLDRTGLSASCLAYPRSRPRGADIAVRQLPASNHTNSDQTSVDAKEGRWLRRLSSQHDPSNIFASVGIDYDEIDLSSGPFAQFVETMVVEIVIDKEPPWEGSGAMIFDLDRLSPCHRIALTSLRAIENYEQR